MCKIAPPCIGSVWARGLRGVCNLLDSRRAGC